MQKILPLLLISFICICNLTGQRLYKTGSGQKFLLYDDGHWAFDSTSVSTHLTEVPSSPDTKTQDDQIDYILQKSLENEVQAYISWIQTNNAIAVNNLNLKQADQSTDPVAYALLLETQNNLKKDEKAFLINYGKATQIVNRAKLLNQLQGKKQQKELNELAKMLKTKLPEKTKTDVAPVRDVVIIPSEVTTPIPEPKIADEITGDFNPVDVNDEIQIEEKETEKRPEFKELKKNSGSKVTQCQIKTESYDPVKKILHAELEKKFLFNYTPEKLRNYFKSKDYMVCMSSVSKTGKSVSLHLDLTFTSKDAAKSYGYVPDESMVTIQLVTGKLIRFKTRGDSRPTIEQYTGNIVYSLVVPMDNDAASSLEKVPLDRMGIMWSSGYESYDIYEVDFLMKQLNCLKKIK